MQSKDFFNGRKIVIATMHGKESIIAPLLEKHLGLIPIIVENLDTDVYGTFTREIKRSGNQLEAARKKAYKAMELAKTDLAVASEGSFGTHPSVPFIQSNLELLVLIDTKNNLEIRGDYRTEETNMDGQYIQNIDEALAFARRIGFPEHGVIVRKSKDSKSDIYKNISTEKELSEIVSKLLGGLFTKKVYIETDMRAHKNPTRMKAIEFAVIDLVKNIQSLCPQCNTPGFVVADIQKGLQCSSCLLPTQLPIYEVFLCTKCNYRQNQPITIYGKYADPMYCQYCNP